MLNCSLQTKGHVRDGSDSCEVHSMICPVHIIIDTQTFSVCEMEFLVRNAEEYKVCKRCVYLFENRIKANVGESLRSRVNRAVSDGQAGSNQATVPSGSGQKR